MRALGIELRRSAALWAGLLIVLVGLGFFYALPGPWGKGSDAWTEEWFSLAMWQRWLLNLLWPLAVGAGAWQGRRDRRSKMDELLSATPRPAFQRALPPVVAMCAGVTAAYLVIFFVGAVQVIGNASYVGVGWVPVMLVGILSMIAAVLAGMGVGRIFPFLLTAPIAAVLTMAATTVALVGAPGTGSVVEGTVSWQFALLTPVFDFQDDLFVTVSTPVNLVQALWFAGLTITGFGLLTLVGRKARLLALLPALAALAITLPLLPSSAAGILTPDTSAAALVCEDRVCVSRLHQDHLPEIAGPVRQALAQLAKLPGAPTVVQEARMSQFTMDTLPPSADIVFFHFDDYEFQLNPRRTILAGPDLHRYCDWEIGKHAAARRMVVASWFDGELRPVASRNTTNRDVETEAKRMWQELRALPVDQQPAKVAELRAQSPEC